VKRSKNSRLRNSSALIGIGTRDKNGLVLEAIRALDELLERRVRLDKVVCRQLNAQFVAEILDPLRLMLASAIGEEDEGDVVLVEELQRLHSSRNGLRNMKQNTVNAARKC